MQPEYRTVPATQTDVVCPDGFRRAYPVTSLVFSGGTSGFTYSGEPYSDVHYDHKGYNYYQSESAKHTDVCISETEAGKGHE